MVGLLPTHLPLLQVSVWVHGSLSLQEPTLLATSHWPVAALQTLVWQGPPAWQLVRTPDVQLPFWQASPTVHLLPSSQGEVLNFGAKQPLAGSQMLSVQTRLSSQFLTPVVTQVPF
jgi:hypothetical protein